MLRLLVILLSFIMVGCSSSANQSIASHVVSDIAKPDPNILLVDDIKIMMTELFPIEVNVLARGNLPDNCTVIDQITEEQNGNTLVLKITTAPHADKICSNKVKQSFAEVIPLNVTGLYSGFYKVKVNNRTDVFELGMDNIIR
ncbi:hypothetical protein QUF74_03775 [Candidatus Halobeggiatoa sp. HSG11]|nr:hypothetical protein [Candidatus Halobeggiatoa sp. HSG11]